MRKRDLRLVKQSEAAECGLACLTMVARFHGAETDLAAMRGRFEPSLRGTSLKSLMASADRIGLIPRALQLPLEELADLELPAVLHWDMAHYVVLERATESRFLIHDPADRSGWMELAEVSKHFTGVALELRPSGIFDAPPPVPSPRMHQLWSRIYGLRRSAAQVIVLSTGVEVLGLAAPYYLQVGVDSAVPTGDVGFLALLGCVFIAFAVLQAAMNMLKSAVITRSGAQIGFSLAVNVARHLLRLPISWHQRRMLGDTIGRLNAIETVQEVLSRGGVQFVIDGAFALISLLVMIAYSRLLTLVTVAASCLTLAFKLWILPLETAAERKVISAVGAEQTTVIECLRGMTSIRMMAIEQERHSIWQNQRSEVANARATSALLHGRGDAVGTFITAAEAVITSWIGIEGVVGGTLTLGMLFAFFALKSVFWVKAKALTDQIIVIRTLRIYLERIGDIVLAGEDPCFQEREDDVPRRIEVVELRNVSYRYSPDDPFILRDINLVITLGSHIAITGESGGGKSTLVRILLGLVAPTSGELLINGISACEFGFRNYYRSISAVLQEDALFTGSLRENVSMFDGENELKDVQEVCELAAISADIDRMPMGYHSLVGDMGSSLSSGQRQRILIARALYRRPALLVMDEGTSHLDTGHEATIAANLNRLQITRVTIAHREETLRHASARYRLAGGTLNLEPS